MDSEITLRPIGIVRTSYKDKSDTPRQPGALGETLHGRIILHGGENFEQALKDIVGFERIWVLSWFHRNTTWKPLVLPPDERTKHGVFATRSPHRPNQIGLSLCRLIRVKGRTLIIENPDLLDRTPVLDIKPYVPSVDSFPGSRSGWMDDREANRQAEFKVRFDQPARDRLLWLKQKYTLDLEKRILAQLKSDPFPHPYRRIRVGTDSSFTLSVRSWRIAFTVEDRTVRVTNVLSGYAAATLLSGPLSQFHDGPAHLAFHRRWPLRSL